MGGLINIHVQLYFTYILYTIYYNLFVKNKRYRIFHRRPMIIGMLVGLAVLFSCTTHINYSLFYICMYFNCYSNIYLWGEQQHPRYMVIIQPTLDFFFIYKLVRSYSFIQDNTTFHQLCLPYEFNCYPKIKKLVS